MVLCGPTDVLELLELEYFLSSVRQLRVPRKSSGFDAIRASSFGADEKDGMLF